MDFSLDGKLRVLTMTQPYSATTSDDISRIDLVDPSDGSVASSMIFSRPHLAAIATMPWSNDPPIDLNSTAVHAFSENQPVGTIIGELNATDTDGHAINYRFVTGENNKSLFTLDTNGTLKTATAFDYESNASTYTISVQAKDELNATTEGNFTK